MYVSAGKIYEAILRSRRIKRGGGGGEHKKIIQKYMFQSY